MKLSGWLAAALVASGVVYSVGGGSESSEPAPDERLAARFVDICEIARDNIRSPVNGVRALGAYADKHTGDALREWGDTLAAIERIQDDEQHDDRAVLARSRLRAPLRACEPHWVRFFRAVDESPEATALVERFHQRLNRTLEIILAGTSIDVRTLPMQLDRTLAGATPY